MIAALKLSRLIVLPNRFRILVVALVSVATPGIAQADVTTQRGLESLALSVGFLAAAVAFAGVVIALAIYWGSKSRHD